MKLEQIRWKNNDNGWEIVQSEIDNLQNVQLVMVFGDPNLVQVEERYQELKSRYPQAHIAGGSTAGNILGTTITDEDIVATAVFFEKSQIKVLSADIDNPNDLQSTAANLVQQLKGEDFKHVLVLSDGIHFNGSELAKGMNTQEDAPVTGGLMGDKGQFKETYVFADSAAKPKRIVLIGFYGKDLFTGYGCFAGWGEFGVDRIITKSAGNIVYEIDGQPALKLYKKYLGEFAEQLPASGLRFPLSIRRHEKDYTLIRTLLCVDEEKQSLTFAGDVPEGSITLLMKGNIDDLISSAGIAAKEAKHVSDKRGLAIVISCVGRKQLMDQMTDEELETVQNTLGGNTWMTGFYSYGELAPYNKEFMHCNLHNQTLTLTTLYED
ncbi:MAG: FIST C-terminal domain-containing protein [Candidatus Omnitrophica bacterium]|nr:FIST C-terminal domain-containing protein [Candidatus Omnitrophota bacterium]